MKTYQITVEDKDSELLFQILRNLKIVKHFQDFDSSSQIISSKNADTDNWTDQDWQEFDQELADRRKHFSSFNVDDL